MKRITVIAFLIIAAITNTFAANPLDVLGNIVNNVTQSNKFEITDLQGTWKYQSPAISFKSDNALNQIGGVAASTTVETKLAPYYKRLGLTNAVLTFDDKGNFTIALKKITLKGTVTKDNDEGLLTFNFTPNGQFSLGKVSARATKSATGILSLTFDATRVIGIVQKIATFSQNSTLTTLSTLLGTYDGIYAGAKLKKQK